MGDELNLNFAEESEGGSFAEISEEEGSSLEESEEEEAAAKEGDEDENLLFVELEDGTTFTYCRRNYARKSRNASCRRCKKGWISDGSSSCHDPKDPRYKKPKAKPCTYGYHRVMGNCKRIKKGPKPKRNKNLKCKSGFRKFQGKCYPKKITLSLPKTDKKPKKMPKRIRMIIRKRIRIRIRKNL